MLVTEEEARTKECRAIGASLAIEVTVLPGWAHPEGGVTQRIVDGPRCIGSACMMWREGSPLRELVDGVFFKSIDRGFCGLAGKSPVIS